MLASTGKLSRYDCCCLQGVFTASCSCLVLVAKASTVLECKML